MNNDDLNKAKPSLAGNIRGGLGATLMGLPGNIIFGMLAFAPLGIEYISFGIISSLIGSVIVGFFTSLFCSTKLLISGPRPTIALFFASVMVAFSTSLTASGEPVNPLTVLAFGFLITALSGLMQIIFGLFRMGSLVRFIPITVISGFVTATSVVIVLGQIWNISGIPAQASLLDFFYSVNKIETGVIAIAFFSAFVTWHARLFTKHFPEGILGIIFGTIVYYSLLQNYPEIYFGQTLEMSVINIFELIKFPINNVFSGFNWQDYIIPIISGAFGMALLSSVDTLLTSSAIDSKMLERSNYNQDLTAQGFANLLSSCLGGLSGAGKIGVCLYAYKNGARSKIAGYAQSLLYIPIIFFAIPYIQLLPNAVLGGVACTIGIRLIDQSLIKDVINIVSHKLNKSSIHQKFNVLIIFVIIFTTLIWDMITAMILGLILSIIFFLFIFSGSIIRRELSGNAIQSIYKRNIFAREFIDNNRNSIIVLQLEGAVFFGSAELLARRIEILIDQNIKYIILDMHRVAEIDSTGASIIRHQQLMLREKNIFLLLSYTHINTHIYKELESQKVCSYSNDSLCFSDTSSAFIWCEDKILEQASKNNNFTDTIVNLQQIELFHDLDEEYTKILTHYLRKIDFSKQTCIFKQGDTGDFVLFIVKGKVEVYVDIEGLNHSKQLQILGPGTVVGEMALIDGKPRSASLKALTNVVCLSLTRKLYLQLLKEHPIIASQLLSGFCQIFSQRLRVANKMISELES